MRNEETTQELVRQVRHLRRSIGGLLGEHHRITLQNQQTYPFNDSAAIIALDRIHGTNDYFINVQVLEAVGGGAGQVLVTQKMRNGFQIAFTGAACKVTLDIWILDRE